LKLKKKAGNEFIMITADKRHFRLFEGSAGKGEA
jgi:hypothetical protein